MLKKSLHDQIKIIGFWTVGGVFWYLVIAFFLKSKYPIFDYSFNLEIAYDVIKDALTLAASFLAPVAAFVLFSDWRVQHKALKNEKLSEDILRILNTYYPFIILILDQNQMLKILIIIKCNFIGTLQIFM